MTTNDRISYSNDYKSVASYIFDTNPYWHGHEHVVDPTRYDILVMLYGEVQR